MKAAVILTKCKQSHELFGIRAEQREDSAWYATWAFKVSEHTASREKFGDTEISGNVYVTNELSVLRRKGIFPVRRMRQNDLLER